MIEHHRVIGHVVAVHGFRVKIELSPQARSSSRATLDGVQRAVAINAFVTFELGAGGLGLGILAELEARETYDPSRNEELSLELTKPRRVATVQLMGTVTHTDRGGWTFDPGITVLPTLDTPAEVADPDILVSVFGAPPKQNRPEGWSDRNGAFDFAVDLGHRSGDEYLRVKASFNDLFSRPLAVVGNTGSGKSFTVASLLRKMLHADVVSQAGCDAPHVFILDINGEYANAFLDEESRGYVREPNVGYVNGAELSVPAWLMNSEEVCEWLSAAEQTQQPVLKAWWADLKAPIGGAGGTSDYLAEAQAAIGQLQGTLFNLRRNELRDRYLAIKDFLSATSISLERLGVAAQSCMVRDANGTAGYKNHFGDTIHNPREVDEALMELAAAIDREISDRDGSDFVAASGDTPMYVEGRRLRDPSNLAAAAAKEDAPRIEQHLTTLRLRLATKLADRRWSVFCNYDAVGISSTESWFRKIGFGEERRVTVLDLSMLAHEVLPYVCAVVGRVLLEAREKLPADRRYENPWVLVLEEAHNYARPARLDEDRGQTLSRKAFERVAKEGRKFGLSLIVASQRPSEISPTIISQCANFLAHRLQNPDDIDHFRRIIPMQARRLLDQVTVLAAGEAIAFGSSMHIPVRVKVDLPESAPWSATAAPYAEWGRGVQFPLTDVLSAWGISNGIKEGKADTDRQGS